MKNAFTLLLLFLGSLLLTHRANACEGKSRPENNTIHTNYHASQTSFETVVFISDDIADRHTSDHCYGKSCACVHLCCVYALKSTSIFLPEKLPTISYLISGWSFVLPDAKPVYLAVWSPPNL